MCWRKNILIIDNARIPNFSCLDRISNQISRECFEHAKALTCRKFYPECNGEVGKAGKANVRPLCGSDCKYVKEICKGEYRRMLSSPYYQAYFPICKVNTIYPDNVCWHLPTYNPSKGIFTLTFTYICSLSMLELHFTTNAVYFSHRTDHLR